MGRVAFVRRTDADALDAKAVKTTEAVSTAVAKPTAPLAPAPDVPVGPIAEVPAVFRLALVDKPSAAPKVSTRAAPKAGQLLSVDRPAGPGQATTILPLPAPVVAVP